MSWHCLINSLKIIDKLVRNTENINYGGKKKKRKTQNLTTSQGQGSSQNKR